VRAIILDPANQSFVSLASVWEISINVGLGKLDPLPDEPDVLISDSELLPLNIKIEHANLAGRLPLLHRDPFDRMLVAQAQIEDLIIITNDGDVPKYGVPTLRP
jgi:PIN domain nuclease of toxin-antitoxin system